MLRPFWASAVHVGSWPERGACVSGARRSGGTPGTPGTSGTPGTLRWCVVWLHALGAVVPGLGVCVPSTARDCEFERAMCYSGGVLKWPAHHSQAFAPPIRAHGATPHPISSSLVSLVSLVSLQIVAARPRRKPAPTTSPPPRTPSHCPWCPWCPFRPSRLGHAGSPLRPRALHPSGLIGGQVRRPSRFRGNNSPPNSGAGG